MSTTKWLVLVTIGVTLLGIVGSVYDLDDKIASDFPFLAIYVEQIEFVFLAVVVFLTGAVTLALWYSVKELWDQKDYAESGPMRRRLQHFSCHDMQAIDFPRIMQIYHGTTPGNTSIEVSSSVYGKCKKGWKKVVDNRDGQIVGYFIVLPLSKKGENAILEKEFDFSHPNIDAFFNMKHRNDAPAYIGMVGAEVENQDARAFALNRLKFFVNSYRFSRIYARAATADGLRLVKKQSFSKVFEEDRYEQGVMFVKSMR
jgi:hypothetical protein